MKSQFYDIYGIWVVINIRLGKIGFFAIRYLSLLSPLETLYSGSPLIIVLSLFWFLLSSQSEYYVIKIYVITSLNLYTCNLLLEILRL